MTGSRAKRSSRPGDGEPPKRSRTKAPHTASSGVGTEETSGASLPIVGIGASAGGITALKELFQAAPVDTGMAFVVIQHLDPTHESQMASLLAGNTSLRVLQAEEGMAVEPNTVYTIPPGRYLS